MNRSRRAIFALALVCFASSCRREPSPQRRAIPQIQTAAKLSQHSKLFRRRVETVTEGIHVAIGFGLANSIMIEGESGLIIVDTMGSTQEAGEVLAEFRKISPKPIAAVIYTHNHVDHVLGAEVFAKEDGPEIYAHESTEALVDRLVTELRPIVSMRSMRMFGTFLDEKGLVNAGIGPFLGIGEGSSAGFVRPTRTFSESYSGEAAGVAFELVHAPGETDDQLFVWLPEKRALLCGDNFYWSFPNLYTIRGTPFRSLKSWYQSLDKMRDRHPRFLVPSHTVPVIGEEEIEEVLTDYRDAIQFVHDQSIRAMNMGMTPDEMAERIRLPEHLAAKPYLQPYYGKVSWSVRAMFAGNLGWFDGDPAGLEPLSREERAKLMARLAGGRGRLLERAEEALADGQFQVALELSGDLLRLDPDDERTKRLRIRALVSLGEREENANARHYYLTEALEIRDGFVARQEAKPTAAFLRRLPAGAFFDALAVNLDPEASARIDRKVLIEFPDAGQAFLVHVRRGVAEVREVGLDLVEREEAEIHVVADSAAWKEMLARLRNRAVTIAGFQYKRGNPLAFARFLKLFAPPPAKLAYAPPSN